MSQKEKAEAFARLHRKGDPVILFNVWDAGTAKVVSDAGAKAIATGSWAVAAANGFTDGENIPLDLAIENVARIVRTVELPVTLDLESGYSDSLDVMKSTISRVIDAGVIGINFEDQIVGSDGLYPPDVQAKRIAAIREAADKLDIPLYINARTDVFLKAYPAAHTHDEIEEAIARAENYAAAGASGFFAPGLRDAELIQQLCNAVSMPVNIMVLPDTPSNSEMASLGVARISYGAGPYRQAMEALQTAAATAFS